MFWGKMSVSLLKKLVGKLMAPWIIVDKSMVTIWRVSCQSMECFVHTSHDCIELAEVWSLSFIC